MEFGSFQVPADEVGIPFFSGNCDTQESAVLFGVLTEIRAGFLRNKWNVGIRLHHSFDADRSSTFSDENLPLFIIVNLKADMPSAHFEEMRQFAGRGTTVLGIMLGNYPGIQHAFEAAGGMACFLLPADSTINVQEMQAFIDRGIPKKS